MASVLDLTIDEGDTFTIAIDYWDNLDKTLPTDLTDYAFSGAMKFGEKFIPMVMTVVLPNTMEAIIDYTQLKELSAKGTYDIDALVDGENSRILQGTIRVNAEVVA